MEEGHAIFNLSGLDHRRWDFPGGRSKQFTPRRVARARACLLAGGSLPGIFGSALFDVVTASLLHLLTA
jgi:hypothetical protein